MISLKNLLERTIKENASDLHLTVGAPPVIRVNGKLKKLEKEKLDTVDTDRLSREILGENYEKYMEIGEIDMSFSIAGLGRFRANVFKQRGSNAIVLRVVGLKIPTLSRLNFPPIINKLLTYKKGLNLVTGPTGCGKSTTLAAMINEINCTRAVHIITLEEPIEYLHRHNRSLIDQREIGKDSLSYSSALRTILREDPDVILIGEMRDLETISTALAAAETGHLVLSSLHTVGAVQTVDRIIKAFPPYHQQQVKIQLASVIKGIISQQLLTRLDGKGRIAALEIMVATESIKNMISEGKIHQIESSIQTGIKYGMKTMEMSLLELYKKEYVSYEEILTHCADKNILTRMVSL